MIAAFNPESDLYKVLHILVKSGIPKVEMHLTDDGGTELTVRDDVWTFDREGKLIEVA